MTKETFYFSHDYNARTDEKIKKLIRVHGILGYGIYWAIIEDLYQNANALQTDYEGIAYELRLDKEIVKSVVIDFGLFQIENDLFGSLSVQRRLEERDKKSEKARENAFKRWNKDANAMPPHSESNAIKERKGKEIKVNEIKENIGLVEISKIEIVFNEFIKCRKQMKKPVTDHAKNLLKKELAKLSGGNEDLGIKIIEQSIKKGWLDFYPLKVDNETKTDNLRTAYNSALEKLGVTHE